MPSRWPEPSDQPSDLGFDVLGREVQMDPRLAGWGRRLAGNPDADLFHGPRSEFSLHHRDDLAAQCSRPPPASRAGSVQSKVTISP